MNLVVLVYCSALLWTGFDALTGAANMLSISKHFNRTLALSVLLIAISQFNYGFDNQVDHQIPVVPLQPADWMNLSTHTLKQAFAQTQAMEAFDTKFGEYDPVKGTYEIPTQWLSLMNGLPFIGLAVGMNIPDPW